MTNKKDAENTKSNNSSDKLVVNVREIDDMELQVTLTQNTKDGKIETTSTNVVLLAD